MITNENAEFPGDAHGLGFELDQRWYMGGLASLRTAGHTGYTGTSLVIDFSSRSFVILLTNRVHPSRSWGSVNPARVAAAQGLAESLAVRPREGRDGLVLAARRTPARPPSPCRCPLTATGPAELAPVRRHRERATCSPCRSPPTTARPGPRCPTGSGGEVVDGGVRGLRTAALAPGAAESRPGRHGRPLDLHPGRRPVRPRDLPGRHHRSGQGRRTVVDAEHHPGRRDRRRLDSRPPLTRS